MRKYLEIILVLIIIFLSVSLYDTSTEVNLLRSDIQTIQDDIIETTTVIYLNRPDLLFKFLDNWNNWEKIEAVPYSECYRHVIDDQTSDYIFCKAI